MRKFKVSAIIEGYRFEDYFMAASEHHAIKLLEAKYPTAINAYAILQEQKFIQDWWSTNLQHLTRDFKSGWINALLK